ncbi:MAG TPA: peptidoglycan-binding protein [Campylobacterales bacterium]|nr:peptidoglycan-binding protein [Campylobacterales bacterium]HHS92389.1 peptidoglycan-binding protein [Campylobacterales bacterium]
MLKINFYLIATISISTLWALDEMPITAKPGQCFTKSFYPPKYKKTIKTTSTKRVKLSESTIKYEVIPAKYSWHEERVKISDGTQKNIVYPAEYETMYEKILIEPEKNVWRKDDKEYSPKATLSCVQAAKMAGMDVENAKNGTCFYEHLQPEKYATVAKRVLVAQASERIETIPATYKTVTKKVATSNSTMKLVPVPVKYKKVQENVVISPAKSEWRKTTCENRGCSASEVVCLTEIPATYKTVTKKIILEPAVAKTVAVEPVYEYVQAQELVTPAKTRKIPIPAEYKTINQVQKISDKKYFWSDASSIENSNRLRTECDKICLVKTPAKYKTFAKKVLVKPASSQLVSTPEEYKTVRVKRVEKEASFKKITVPAEYVEVEVERERTKGYAKWMPIMCESAITPAIVRKVQNALKFQGFYSGEIDGVWDFDVKAAVRAYQKANNLAVTRLSIETMKSLGIE